MDHFAAYTAYALTLAIAGFIPGPGVAALVGQSLGGHARTGFAFLAGITLGDTTYLTLAIVGLAAIAQSFSVVLLLIKLAGGLYLVYLAYKFWTMKTQSTEVRELPVKSLWSTFVSGYVLTLGNPKTIVFYVAILPSVVDLQTVTFTSWAVLAFLTIAVLFTVLTPYILLAVRTRHFFSDAKSLQKLNRVAAGFIGTAGLLIISEAMREIWRRV